MRELSLDVPLEMDMAWITEYYDPQDIKVELVEGEVGQLPHPKIQITIGRVIMEIRSDDADKIATLIHNLTRKRA
jgi:hypothetical protein